MAPASLTRRELQRLLAEGEPCASCQGWLVDPRHAAQLAPANAAAVEPAGVIHLADAITGATLCGRNGNPWRWVIPTAASRQLDEGAR